MYDISRPFKPSGTQERSIGQLNRLRNEFIHFVPKGWSLEVSGLPQIVGDCLNAISFLVFECGNVIWHETALETQTRVLIEKMKLDASPIWNTYDR